MTLIDNIREGWLRKALAARADLTTAVQAPALFKPEWVEQRQADLVRALGWLAYFEAQS